MEGRYGSKKCVYDGIRFDSAIEVEFYKHAKSNPSIYRDLECHPKYVLQEKFTVTYSNGVKYNIRAIDYEGDFKYTDSEGIVHVVDIKGMKVEKSALKRKMFMNKYRDIELHWLNRYKGEWVDWFDNEDRKRKNRKERLKKL